MLTHKGTQTLRTSRLTLRRFTPEDAAAMFQNWASDGRVTRYLTWQPHGSPEETRKLLESWCAGYEDPAVYNWAMEYNGTVIGSICVTHLDETSECAELGYCAGYDFWNQGLMTEAVERVISYLFGQVGLHRISIRHALKNPGSGRVAQKCGLTCEGIMRQSFKSAGGEFLDIAWYGILRDEWEGVSPD